MKRIVSAALVGAAFLAGGAVVTAQEEPKQAPQTRVYVIQPGDTLWDLSATHLNSPWYWPRIWHVNPQITNPHRIFAGQSLTIPGRNGEFSAPVAAAPTSPAPVSQAAAAATEAVVAAAPATAPVQVAKAEPEPEPAPAEAEAEPAPEEEPQIESPQGGDMMSVEQELPGLVPDSQLRAAIIARPDERRFYVRLGSEGFVSKDKLKAAAAVVGAHTEKMLYTQHDLVFISLGEGSGVEVGQMFTAYRTEQEVLHPVTKKFVGYRTKQLGVLQVTKVNEDVATAVILEAYDSVDKGSFLVPFQPYEKRIAPQATPEALDGYVILGEEGTTIAGENSVIYVDKGSDANLAVGQVFEFIRPMANEIDPVTKKSLRLPPKILGQGIVVDTQPQTASVLVIDSRDAIDVGDRIRPVAD
jgi:hypothetical protein